MTSGQRCQTARRDRTGQRWAVDDSVRERHPKRVADAGEDAVWNPRSPHRSGTVVNPEAGDARLAENSRESNLRRPFCKSRPLCMFVDD